VAFGAAAHQKTSPMSQKSASRAVLLSAPVKLPFGLRLRSHVCPLSACDWDGERKQSHAARIPCIRGPGVEPRTRVLLSQDMSVWGLSATVAESVTFRHVRRSRCSSGFPLWRNLETSDCWGALCSRVIDARA
jgi:hypothetical protein